MLNTEIKEIEKRTRKPTDPIGSSEIDTTSIVSLWSFIKS